MKRMIEEFECREKSMIEEVQREKERKSHWDKERVVEKRVDSTDRGKGKNEKVIVQNNHQQSKDSQSESNMRRSASQSAVRREVPIAPILQEKKTLAFDLQSL